MGRVVKIPTEFQLLGHRITVEYDPNLADREDALGVSHFESNRIVLQSPCRKRSKSVIAQAFYHELVHFVFWYAGQSKLALNEKVVDQVAQLVYQSLVTATY